MTAFEITIQNIQKVLDIINNGGCTKKSVIASEMNVSTTLVNKILKRIEHEISYVDGVYKATCTKAEDTEFYKKFSAAIQVVISDPTIMLWQNKYISSMFDLSSEEVQALRTYVSNKIQIDKLFQRR